jgi:N-carbamoylputrescine amidase
MQKMVVAAVSPKSYINQKDRIISNMEKWIIQAKQKRTDLILFPELNITGYFPNDIVTDIAEKVPGPSSDKVIKLAEKYEIVICYGLVEKDDGKFYCTQVLTGENGIIGKQRKIHVPAHEQRYWTFGDRIDVFDIGKAKVGISICRDSFFGEMTRTLYFKGAELILMPFAYYNFPRKDYLRKSIHGMSIIKASWTNGTFNVVCNHAEYREPSEWEPKGRKYPGWAGVIDPWGDVVNFISKDGNSEEIVIEELDPGILNDRRSHPHFLAEELRVDLYQLSKLNS